GKLKQQLQFGLGLSSLALLASPSTPDEVIDEMTQRVERGEKPTGNEIKAAIDERKPSPTDKELRDRADRWSDEQRRKSLNAPSAEQSATDRKQHADHEAVPAKATNPTDDIWAWAEAQVGEPFTDWDFDHPDSEWLRTKFAACAGLPPAVCFALSAA